MKYTIPYDDKITLPHIKKIDSIGINADNLNYDRKELIGEVIISGEYLLDNSKDIMEFNHDIPVSFLIDDETISPLVNISNFKYELIPGRGIEVMFDLDVILSEIKDEEEVIAPRDLEKPKPDVVNESTENIKEVAEEVIAPHDLEKPKPDVVNESTENIKEVAEEVEVVKEKKTKKRTRQKTEEEEIKEFQEKIDENLDVALNNRSEKDEEKEIEIEIEPLENEDNTDLEIVEELEDILEEDYPDEFEFSTNLMPTMVSFDTGFVPRDNDKFTTYKILLVEENENIDELLEARNLAKALICNEYKFDKKIVLKIENE